MLTITKADLQNLEPAESSRSYITIPNGDVTETYPVDTVEQTVVAAVAIRDAGLESAPVYHGDPDCPDSYRDAVLVVHAAPAENDMPGTPGGPLPIHDFGLSRRPARAELLTELVATDGPTGRFVEALEVAVVDYGGNELGRATTMHGLSRVLRQWQATPTQIRVLRTGAEVRHEDVDPDALV